MMQSRRKGAVVDIRNCSVCKKEFDLDVAGLVGPHDIVVCGNTCAKKSASSRGNEYAIHDRVGDVIETNQKPDGKPRRHLW